MFYPSFIVQTVQLYTRLYTYYLICLVREDTGEQSGERQGGSREKGRKERGPGKRGKEGVSRGGVGGGRNEGRGWTGRELSIYIWRRREGLYKDTREANYICIFG